MPTFNILSIDGGGIRGVFTAVLLQRLHEQTGFLTKVHLFAGTSTGGILALGLAKGLKPEELVALYRDNGEKIFKKRGLTGRKGLLRSRYLNKGLKKVLTERVGKDKLKDYLPRHVLVAAFDLDNENPDSAARTWKAKFFHNFPGDDSDGDERVLDVAMRTSAAPTYFPAYQGFIDGGVVANSPSMAAVAQALDEGTAGRKLSELRLLSLSTGSNHAYIAKPKSPDWGAVQWARPLIDIFMDGAMGVADYQCRRLLKDRYHRLGPGLPGNKPIKMDDWRSVPKLMAFAEEVAESSAFRDTCTWIQKNFR